MQSRNAWFKIPEAPPVIKMILPVRGWSMEVVSTGIWVVIFKSVYKSQGDENSGKRWILGKLEVVRLHCFWCGDIKYNDRVKSTESLVGWLWSVRGFGLPWTRS
jgi:hypothetical protein